MSMLVVQIFSFSIFIAGLISVVRFNTIAKNYHPYIFLLWIGCANELVSTFLVSNNHFTIINSNVYVLVEALFLTWFFQKSKLFERTPQLFGIIVAALCLFWLMETIVLHNIHHYGYYFRIFYSAVVVLMSISAINYLLTTEDQFLLKNATFLFCIGFLLYFIIKVLVNSFWAYGLTSSLTFLKGISNILVLVNLFTNLIYALAVLCIPKKQPSLLPL